MTRFRATLATLACATALNLSAATTPALAQIFSELQGYTTQVETVDLPSPPKFAVAPKTAEPRHGARRGRGAADSVDLPYVAGHGSPSRIARQKVVRR